MTTSGATSWNPAVAFIVRSALIKVGAIADDEYPTGQQYEDGVFQLNALVKSTEATGLHVWAEEEAILFIQPGQNKYVIGGPTPSLNANTSDADMWEELTLQSNAAGGATTITVNTAAAVVSGMNIGVIMNDGTTFWTTASGAPSGNNIPLTAPIPAAGASSGAFVLAYTTKIDRPLKVPKARLLQLNGLIETPMTIMSRQEYEDQPNKRAPGTPTQWFYSPRRDQGFFYIWPVPVTTSWAIRFTWYRPLQDFLTPNNTADFPQEWVNPLIWKLADEICMDFDVPVPRQQLIRVRAGEYAELVLNYDRESEPIQLGMDWAFQTEG